MAPRDTLADLDRTLEQLLEFIAAQGAVSFTTLREYMVTHRLRLGTAANPIEVLDLAAYETGRIDVDYDHQMIYGRKPPAGAAIASQE